MSLNVFPYFQPIVETATGSISGYEALARMEDEQGNVVSAGHIFSDPHMSVQQRIDIDRDVRFKALQKLRELPDDTYLSINVSPEWLQYLESLDDLPTLDMLKNVAGDPSRIVIEITELDGDLVSLERIVKRYREQGFKIAIDDFGTGFSQLDRIAILKPDIIKLDMTLIKHGVHNGRGSSIVQMLGEMASRLGSKVLCEGVETEEEYYLALSCNAMYVQGFLFSQATKEFLMPSTTCHQVQGLLTHYCDQAVDATSRNHWRVEKIKAELLALREVLRSAVGLDFQDFVASKHLLRFYICDRQGYQISPNFENNTNGWLKDERHRGYNWSWRPYFLELIGGWDTRNKIVFSAPYQDIHTGQRAQTAVMFIDDNRVLLADLMDEKRGYDLFADFGGMPISWIPDVG